MSQKINKLLLTDAAQRPAAPTGRKSLGIAKGIHPASAAYLVVM
jgi:hypothetical protein